MLQKKKIFGLVVISIFSLGGVTFETKVVNAAPIRQIQRMVVNRTPLLVQLGYARAYQANAYTTASFAKLTNAINWAQGIVWQPSASQWLINYAVSVLHNNALQLVKIQPAVNRTALVQQLNYATSYKASNYTFASYKPLADEIVFATAIYQRSTATQAQIDQAVATLHTYALKLVAIPNVASANGTEPGRYNVNTAAIINAVRTKMTNFYASKRVKIGMPYVPSGAWYDTTAGVYTNPLGTFDYAILPQIANGQGQTNDQIANQIVQKLSREFSNVSASTYTGIQYVNFNTMTMTLSKPDVNGLVKYSYNLKYWSNLNYGNGLTK